MGLTLDETIAAAGRCAEKDNPVNIDGNVVDIEQLYQAAKTLRALRAMTDEEIIDWFYKRATGLGMHKEGRSDVFLVGKDDLIAFARDLLAAEE